MFAVGRRTYCICNTTEIPEGKGFERPQVVSDKWVLGTLCKSFVAWQRCAE